MTSKNQKVILFISALILLGLPTGCAKKGSDSRSDIGKTPATQRPYKIKGKKYYPISSAHNYKETGMASWYGKPFHGRKTASGITYNMYKLTAAHKTLPMGTILKVKNLSNNKTIEVQINDRGPFSENRVIDLSYAAAKELGILGPGTAPVEIKAIDTQPEPDHRVTRAKTIPIDKKPVIAVPGEQEETMTTSPTVVSNPPPTIINPSTPTYYIHVRTMPNAEMARRLAKQFASKGNNVTIQQFKAAGTYMYRVLVEAGQQLATAKEFKKALQNKGFPYARIVSKE